MHLIQLLKPSWEMLVKVGALSLKSFLSYVLTILKGVELLKNPGLQKEIQSRPRKATQLLLTLTKRKNIVTANWRLVTRDNPLLTIRILN